MARGCAHVWLGNSRGFPPPGDTAAGSIAQNGHHAGRLPFGNSHVRRAGVVTEPPIYLDYNATTPVLPEAVDAMLPYLREHFGNPSSAHAFGRRAKEAVESARTDVAALLECQADEIVFTSGGTEASNLAIRGIAEARSDRPHVVTSVIEHPATEKPCAWLEGHGWRVTRVPVDAGGRVVPGDVQAAAGADTALVTIMHANNETGVVQPIAEIASVAHAAGALMHCDAAQSAGKIPTRVNELDVDLLSLAGHKVYGPKGVGALYLRQGISTAPIRSRCRPRTRLASRYGECGVHRWPRCGLSPGQG